MTKYINKNLKKRNYAGKEICEIKPIKFGGNPNDAANKIALDRKDHIKYVNYWNQLLKKLMACSDPSQNKNTDDSAK